MWYHGRYASRAYDRILGIRPAFVTLVASLVVLLLVYPTVAPTTASTTIARASTASISTIRAAGKFPARERDALPPGVNPVFALDHVYDVGGRPLAGAVVQVRVSPIRLRSPYDEPLAATGSTDATGSVLVVVQAPAASQTHLRGGGIVNYHLYLVRPCDGITVPLWFQPRYYGPDVARQHSDVAFTVARAHQHCPLPVARVPCLSAPDPSLHRAHGRTTWCGARAQSCL